MAQTVNDLKKFLKVLVQESVASAYEEEQEKQRKMATNRLKGLNEEDPLFPDEEGGKSKGKKSSKMDLDDLDAEEGGDDAGGDMGDENMGNDSGMDDFEEPTGELGGAPKAPQAEAPAKDQGAQKSYKPLELDLTLGEITVDGVESMLNLMRGGRSFKDPNVSKELRKYFESLTEAEKLALATFLTALKDIGVGQPAEKAPDPSDPETSLTISSREKGKNIQQQQNTQNPQAQNPQAQQPGAGGPQSMQPQTVRSSQSPEQQQMVQSDELEDTSPPIVVGKRNESVSESFRKQIKELIKRANSSI